MDAEKIAELARLAEGATPGPWKYLEPYSVSSGIYFESVIARHKADAAYIAAASPDVILALIAEMGQLKDLLDKAIVDFSLVACSRCGSYHAEHHACYYCGYDEDFDDGR